jgi:aspartate kinase
MIVMKFGGTSVEDATAIRRVVEIVRCARSRKPLVVLSACAGVTNDLVRAARVVRSGNKEGALAILALLSTRHRQIAEELLTGSRREVVVDSLATLFHELENLVLGVHLLGELTPRSLDTFMSYGERCSCLIVNAAMEELGMSARFVDARTVMVTDASFGAAQPLLDVIASRSQHLLPLLERGDVVVTQGFVGASGDGTVTTIGRGGSDYSAAILGSLLQAEEIQIWTDVDGMMTADPRIVPHSRIIKTISFAEASELAYFGAKVLHPNTIAPAVRLNIPVRVLNSHRPDSEGTVILGHASPERGEVVKSIAYKNGITVINVSSSRMLLAHGFLATLFSIFEESRKSVDVVSTSEVSVSLTVDSEEGLDEIEKKLEKIGEIRIERGKSIICVVGEGMKHTPGIAARIFTALATANVNIEMISEGASEINLTVVVDERAAVDAVRALHGEFFPT